MKTLKRIPLGVILIFTLQVYGAERTSPSKTFKECFDLAEKIRKEAETHDIKGENMDGSEVPFTEMASINEQGALDLKKGNLFVYPDLERGTLQIIKAHDQGDYPNLTVIFSRDPKSGKVNGIQVKDAAISPGDKINIYYDIHFTIVGNTCELSSATVWPSATVNFNLKECGLSPTNANICKAPKFLLDYAQALSEKTEDTATVQHHQRVGQ